MGYLVERNRHTFADSTGTLHTRYGTAVTVWRKSASGEWKCVIDSWNENPAEHVLPMRGRRAHPPRTQETRSCPERPSLSPRR